MNQSWGYNARDTNFKSPEQVIHALLGAAGRGANLLVNVGPRPDGTIGPNSASGWWPWASGWRPTARRSTERAGARLIPQAWGVSTIKASSPLDVYLHVLKPADSITLPRTIGSFTPFAFGKTTPLKLVERGNALELTLPESARTPIDTIIVLSPLGYGR